MNTKQLLALALIGGGAYFFWQRYQKAQAQAKAAAQPGQSKAEKTIEAGSKLTDSLADLFSKIFPSQQPQNGGLSEEEILELDTL